MAGATAAKFDANFSDFVAELNKVDLKLKAFQVDADKGSDSARKLADALNGNRIAEQAAIAVKAIQSIDGGVSALTKGEIRRMGALVDEAIEKFDAMGRKVPADLAAVKGALDAARPPLKALMDEAESAQSPMSSMFDMFTQGLGLGSGMAIFNSAMSVFSGITNQLSLMWEEGQKASQIGRAFDTMQGGPVKAAQSITKLREATNGLVTDLDLMTAANKASLLGLDALGVQSDELAGVAVRLGKAMGVDAAKAVDDLTTALSRQSPMILDNLGLKVSLADANAAYALQVGKAESALTDEERKMAFVSAAMDAAKQKAAALGDQQSTLNEKIGETSVAYENARTKLGQWLNENELLNEALRIIIKDLTDSGEVLARFAKTTNDATENSNLFLDVWKEAKARPDAWVPGVRGLEEANALLRIGHSLWETWIELATTAGQKLAGLRGNGAAGGFIDPNALPSARRDRDISLDNGRNAASAALAAPFNARSQKVLDDAVAKYEADQQTRLTEIENAGAQARKSALEKAGRERLDTIKRLDALTGDAQLKAAAELQRDLAAVAAKNKTLTDRAAAEAFNKLFDARKIASANAPQLVAGIDASLKALSTHPGVMAEARQFSEKLAKNLFNPEMLRKGAIAGFKGANVEANLAAAMRTAIGAQGLTLGMVDGKATTQNLLADTYALRRGLDGVGVPLKTINETFKKSVTSSSELLTKVSALSTAFSHMATIGGDAFGGIAQGMGEAVAAIDTSMQTIETLGAAFGGKDNTFAKSTGGKALGGALIGMQLGAMLGAQTGSPWKGAAAGALSGAAGGAMYGGVGAIVGAGAGAISGYFAGRKAQKEARAAMAEQKAQLIALYGTREELLKQAKRLGFSEQEINKNILSNTKDTKAYAATYAKLTEAVSKEESEAKQLAETWGDVARVRGVLDKKQTTDLRNALAGGEGPKADAAIAFLESQTESLLAGIQGALDSGGLTPALVGAIGDSLPAAFAALQRSGLSAMDALKAMQPILASFQTNAVNAGLGSAEGFDTLNAMLGTLNDEKLGPLANAASFASQSMAALNNMGMLNAGTFRGFAESITTAFSAISESKGSEQALTLLHQPLQNLWQLTKDFGYAVDDNTAKMLEQAEAAGTVGDKFRPASERAAMALDKVVEKLDEIIAVFKGDMVNASQEGAQTAGAKILEEFGKVQPVVRVRYEYDTPEAPGTTPGGGGRGTQAARDATQGGDNGDVYIDGERVGFIVGRHLGKVSDYAGG